MVDTSYFMILYLTALVDQNLSIFFINNNFSIVCLTVDNANHVFFTIS